MTTFTLGEIAGAQTTCPLCFGEFWFDFKNNEQGCPHCGGRTYRRNVIEGFNREERYPASLVKMAREESIF